MHVFLTGFMASGKTTVGRLLAGALRVAFFDTDALIEKEAGKPVADIFRDEGEGRFREMERELLRGIGNRGPRPPEGLPAVTLPSVFEVEPSAGPIPSARGGWVIATGGGLPCSDENLELMKAMGTVVYLRIGVDDIIRRVGEGANRPVYRRIKAKGDLRREIIRLLGEREAYYLKADIVAENGNGVSPQDTARRIMTALKERWGRLPEV